MVKTRAPAQLRDAPFGFDPALMFQPVKRRIERALVNLQDFFGNLLDAFRDCPAMQRTGLQRPENQEIESTLQEIHGVECRHHDASVDVGCQQ